MRKIIVKEHDPIWKYEFEKAKKFYENLRNTINVEIQHVGSTSGIGLCAKPILDIDIIVNSKEDSKMVIELLESKGYVYIGNLGIEGREAFKYEDDNPNIEWMDHHLYVCLRGSQNLNNHILLRERLRNDKEAVENYSKLKRELAEKFSDDIDSYIDGKTDFITGLLKEAGMKDEDVKRIESINKKK